MQFPEVLVLGATGRIGRALQFFWQSGDRTGPVLWQSRRPQPGCPSLNWAVFDPLGDPVALARAARDCAVVLNLAGAIPGRGGDLQDNTALAEAAIHAAAQTGARVLLASSAAVYGDRTGVLAEHLPPRPVSPYGDAKAGMETRGAALARDLGVDVCALRIGNIAGLDAILGGWRPGFELDVFADGRSPRRSYIGVEALAQVLAGLCAAPDLPEVLNIAAPRAIGMGDLLTAADLRWTPRPAPDSAIAEVQLDVAALRQLVPLPPGMSDPARMVAQWRMLKAHMQKETGPA